MPTSNSQSGQTFRRNVAPFAPLALALLMNAVPNSSSTSTGNQSGGDENEIVAARCVAHITDFQACHDNYPTGCSKAAGYDAYLNYLKNLTPSPASGGITFLDQPAFENLNASTPPALGQTNNHATFEDQLNELGEGQQRGVIGYLYYYEKTNAESSNCELTGPAPGYGNVDFHIGVGFDPNLANQVNRSTPSQPSLQLQQNSVIVEMTPHYRARFQEGVWTLANLKPALGHKVKVVGQLLVDSEHNTPADNCALDGTPQQIAQTKCWRYSVWELHPVTSFAYCQDDSCTQDSGDWIPIGGNSAGSDGGSGSGENPGEGGKTHKPHPTHSGEPR